MRNHRLFCLFIGFVSSLVPVAASAQPGQPGTVAAPAPPAPAPPAPSATSADGDSDLVTITLRDGQLFRGRILAETQEYIIVGLVSGGEVSIPQSNVQSVKRNDPTVYVTDKNQIFKHDPNRTRYLYGPSAFMLRQGEGYFSQTELLFSTLGVGVTDWLTVQIGSMLPATLSGETNLIVGARVGTRLSDSLHVAAGFNSLVIPDAGAIGLAMGTATLGSPRTHVSVSAGYPFLLDAEAGEALGPVFVSVAANLRMSKHFALVTENWFFSDDDDSVFFGSLAGRFMGEHSAVDVGFVQIEDVDFPIPWLDFTWNWD